MRTITDQTSGITINYPDSLAFAFNPFLVEGVGIDTMSVAIVIGGQIKYIVDVQPFDNHGYADLQEYLQGLFTDISNNIDYTEPMSESTHGMNVTISITATSGENEFGTSFTSYIVWGAVKPDGRDDFRRIRHLMWYKNYPFAFSLYCEADTAILFGNGAAPSSAQEITEEGIYNFAASNLGDAKYSIIYEYAGQLQQATFDNTFDLTFYLAQNVEQRPLLRIDADDCADEGIYLRWVDHHGYIAHWLFKVGDEQRQIAAIREFSRNAYTNYDTHYGWQRGSGRRQSMSRNDIVPLCAPLVTKEQFDYLQDVTSSPIVEMYAGKDENDNDRWVGVGVQPATYTKNRDELQDFVFNLITPETPIQSL